MTLYGKNFNILPFFFTLGKQRLWCDKRVNWPLVQLRKNFYAIRLVYLNDDFRAQERIFSGLPWGWSPTIRDF